MSEEVIRTTCYNTEGGLAHISACNTHRQLFGDSLYCCVLLQDVNKNGSTHDGGIWTMSKSQQFCHANFL